MVAVLARHAAVLPVAEHAAGVARRVVGHGCAARPGAAPPRLSLDEPFSPDPRSRDDYRSTQTSKKKEKNDADRELPPVEDRTLADIFGG